MQSSNRSDIGSLTAPNFLNVKATVHPVGDPQPLVSSKTFCRRVVIYGKKDFRTNNAGNIYVGPTSAVGEQPVTIVPGGETEIVAPPGCKLDLNKWYCQTETDLDGWIIIYDKD